MSIRSAINDCQLLVVMYLNLYDNTSRSTTDEFRTGATKGRQMLSEGSKSKAGLQDCYFEKGPYKRIFEKEAYSSAVRENYLAS